MSVFDEQPIVGFGYLNTASATGQTATIPSGGGQKFVQIPLANFVSNVGLAVNGIDAIVHVRIYGSNPQVTNGVSEPQWGLVPGTAAQNFQAVGITLFASAGTTITFAIMALVH